MTDEFKRLGVFGDWEHPYLTMNVRYQAAIARALGKFVEQGLVYKGKKPVHWCIHCRTALAEAEVEYEDHTSPSIYVEFQLAKDSEDELARRIPALKGRPVSVLIWTTTPWTIPSNLAIAFHPDFDYGAYDVDGRAVIVAEALASRVAEATGRQFAGPIATMKGSELEHIRFEHPLYARPSVGLLGEYVTLEAGTGAVHTAPGHGSDDFNTGMRYGLEIYAPVGPGGHFLDTVELFAGQRVFDANPKVEAALKERGRLWHREDFRHSYPHCWRCHHPVIFLATSQWFIKMDGELGRSGGREVGRSGREVGSSLMGESEREPSALATANAGATSAAGGAPAQQGISGPASTEKSGQAVQTGQPLREAALQAIDRDVKWIPAWGRDRIYNMIANRPDWCISRQRAWGVPIPAVDCVKCGEAILTPELVEQAASVFDLHGADAWYERPTGEFIPAGLVCPKCGGREFERERDILDVWFDSGSSHEAVLPFNSELTWPADMYLEGSDQHRGWFQSSLLVGLGTRGRPPFRQVLTHGFLIDVDGRKMSKSLGNAIQPQEVIKESGAETLRLWVSMSDFREELRVGRQILARVVEAYRKIRNTLRYLLANLYDFDPVRHSLPPASLQAVDRYALARYAEFAREVLDAYDAYDFPAIFQRVNQLTTVDLSAFYADVSKDRLYTFAPASEDRRSAQTAMFIIADGLARLLAPILPVTCEELWRHLPGSREESVHLAEFPTRQSLEAFSDAALVGDWQQLIAIRDDVNRELETARQTKTIGTSLGARVRLRARGETLSLLERYRDALPMLFIASQVDLSAAAGEGAALEIAVERAEGEKCARCWRIVTDISDAADTEGICGRCVDALADGGIAA